eukprot:15470486-Alexandrium_andersonii.AAC.1
MLSFLGQRIVRLLRSHGQLRSSDYVVSVEGGQLLSLLQALQSTRPKLQRYTSRGHGNALLHRASVLEYSVAGAGSSEQFHMDVLSHILFEILD